MGGRLFVLLLLAAGSSAGAAGDYSGQCRDLKGDVVAKCVEQMQVSEERDDAYMKQLARDLAAAAVRDRNDEIKEAARVAALPPAMRGLEREYDRMERISWYSSNKSPGSKSHGGFYLYFGVKDSGQVLPLRLVVSYYGPEWLFIRSAWAVADGVRVVVPSRSIGPLGWERDHDGGMIWEWSDLAITGPRDIEAVRKISRATEVTVRYEGSRYQDDQDLRAEQLEAMREVLQAYEALTRRARK